MRITIVLVAALLLAACSGGGSSPAAASGAPVPPQIEGLGHGIEGLQAYGAQHTDEFGGLYIDPPGGAHVVMLFTGDLERHQAAVDAIQPGTTVRQVEHTEADLVAIMDRIDFEDLRAEGIEVIGTSLDTIGNRVMLEAKADDLTAELRLEVAYGGVVDVTIFPSTVVWENASSGDGWRLLAEGQSRSEAYVVRAAIDGASYADMWGALDLAGDAPRVDFASELVVSFGHGIGSSCPEVRLDDVRIGDGVVFSVTSDPLAPRACTADLLGAVVFVVAIRRDAVPDGFTLWLNEQVASGDGAFSEPVEVPRP